MGKGRGCAGEMTRAEAIKNGWIHDDQLPPELTNHDYDEWYMRSRVIEGVRMGPPFPLGPIQSIRTQCRFCEKPVWAQEDNPEPECDECDELASNSFHESFEVEEALMELTGTRSYFQGW